MFDINGAAIIKVTEKGIKVGALLRLISEDYIALSNKGLCELCQYLTVNSHITLHNATLRINGDIVGKSGCIVETENLLMWVSFEF